MTTPVDSTRSDFDLVDERFQGLPHNADVLWRDQSGDDALWLMDNNTPGTTTPLPVVTPAWHFKAAARFDSPLGNADILWQNDNGALALWEVDGTGVINIDPLPNPGPSWHVVGDNNFDQGSGDDILFQNDNGSLAMWTAIFETIAEGTIVGALAGTQNPGPTWHVVGTGDANGDQFAGVLWQNDNGALALWEDPSLGVSTFTFNTVAALPSVDPSWHVKGMADLNGDGRSDIVFQHASGVVVVWEMNGTTITAARLINLNPGPAWHIVGLRDVGGDGHADILFQNDNGVAAVWENYQPLAGGGATFTAALPLTLNPNPNGHVWDLL